jgi:hypothetical protein
MHEERNPKWAAFVAYIDLSAWIEVSMVFVLLFRSQLHVTLGKPY